MSRSTVLKQERNICRYCEHMRPDSKAYMTDCTKHKRVTFWDSTCSDYSREPGSDDNIGEESEH